MLLPCPRAEVSKWSLSAEYNYSSFRGDVDELLRQGYDVFLEYSDYGIREIKLRLPHGLPFSEDVLAKYMDDEQLVWESDPQGSGGILYLRASRELDSFNFTTDPHEALDAAIHVRELLINGDLRALYLLWLCAADGDYIDPTEVIEPPVPHGIADISDQCEELLLFFGIDPFALAAAGKDVGAAPPNHSQNRTAQWVESLDHRQAKNLLLQFLTDNPSSLKSKLRAEICSSTTSNQWPTTDKRRNLEELLETASTLRKEAEAEEVRQAQAKAKRDAEKAERERAQRIKEMLKDPHKWLKQPEQLVNSRETDSYKAAAEILHELRQAVGGSEGTKIARNCAAKLAQKYPTLNRLKSALRARGLLDK